MKEKLKMFDRNSTKGITLIALVVTIIVLLILAGVSIATLTGPNGLLTRANDAKTATEKAGAKEKVHVEVAASYDNRGNLSTELLNKNLENVAGLTSGTPITNFPATVVVDGYEVTIDEDGNVTVEGETTNPPAPPAPPTGDVVTTPPTTPVDKETIFQDTSSGNKEAVIPEGFSVSGKTEEQKIDKGLVVIAPDGSEFVWVPVDKTSLCVDGIADKEVAEIVSGTDYRGQLYNFSGTNSTKRTYSGSSYREPAYLTDTTNGDTNTGAGHNTIGITQKVLQDEYNGIINSIKEHGGFYIGRYESSLSETGYIQSKKGIMPTSAANAGTKTWYGLYQKQKEYATEINNKYQTKVKSGMIYGSMYDAVMNWALSDESEKVKVTASSTQHSLQATGLAKEDVIKNIYDLGNNLREWIAEADKTSIRVLRGGSYDDTSSPRNRFFYYPSNTYSSNGSRSLLYL